MDERNPKLLDEVIEKTLQDAKDLEAGTKEHTAAVESATQLYKLRIEEEKLKADVKDRREQRSQEQGATALANSIQADQLREQRIDRWLNLGLQVALTAGGWIAFTVWQSREQRFELTGTPSTPMFRALLSRMVPNLKK